MIDVQLLQKYNVPIPRYTSYPTVPYWQDDLDVTAWKALFSRRFAEGNKGGGVSLYIHLPFCESLCTYCGCNKKITTNHKVEDEYMAILLKEWQMYLDLMSEPPVVREIHLGGGTPTFFSPENLTKLIQTILDRSVIHPNHDFSFEGHPNNTTVAHLQALYDIGFRRVSYGVQDMDPEVQRVINRMQPFENVKAACDNARAVGYTSVNFDLIYGLPLQTFEKMQRTIEQCISLRPERVAFYSYAHVPWTSKGQRLFDENDLPTVDEKMKLYLLGKKMFAEAGYHDIGMDHFSLPGDDLHNAFLEGRLHRNFMGYTTQQSAILLGLGVSSISDTGNGYAQNDKTFHDYYAAIEAGNLAVKKGCIMTEEDSHFKKYILDISCKGRTSFRPGYEDLIETYTMPELRKLEADNLVVITPTGVEATEQGRNFIRNIAATFDMHLQRNKAEKGERKFSKAI
jgi:oxygen-independent coproporphyrinogen-3 oxidase